MPNAEDFSEPSSHHRPKRRTHSVAPVSLSASRRRAPQGTIPVLVLLILLGGFYGYWQSRSLVALSERIAESVGPSDPPGPPYASDDMPFPDGRRHFRLTTDPYLYLASDDVYDGRTQRFTPPAKSIRSLVGITPDDRLIASSFFSGGRVSIPGWTTAQLSFWTYGVNGNLTPLANSTATVPKEGDVGALSLSPPGDRLLWVINFTRPFPATGSLIRRFPNLLTYFPLRHSVGLWVSDARGQGLHPLGEQSIPHSAPGSNAPPVPERFRWTEDGQGIRFVYDGAVYLIPAP